MKTWHIPEWAISTALCGVLGLGAVDLYLMRRHPVKPHPRAQSQNIGLHAAQDGDALRVQWNPHSRLIVNADRAVLVIADGGKQRQVLLSGAQLDGSSVRYWPESERVSFRMEVFRGDQHTSESLDAASTQARLVRQAGRAEVEKLRPSPFEHVQPEIVVVQYRPAAPVVHPREEITMEAPKEEHGSFDRVLSKIPLLRRLRKHREFDENETPQTPR